jgi:membrane protein implicated in regulation of membrane protease activity
MAQSTIWWLIAGGLVAVELLTGTFYLLMLAIGMAAAAFSAMAGLNATVQILLAAIVGGGAVIAWHMRQVTRHVEPPAQANVNVNLDIGELVHIDHWNADGTADVQYRGARWTAIHRTGVIPGSGAHKVAELVGNRLLVDKA